MRCPFLALTGALLGGACLLAQPPAQPPAPPQPDPHEARLLAILQNWEKAMGSINSLVAECTRTQVDKVFQSTKVFTGKAKFLKPNKASLEMRNKQNPDDFEKYVCSGSELCVYNPKAQTIQIHKLPPPKPGQPQEDNFLSFLMGMKAAEAMKRYKLTLLPSTPETEKWYFYVQVLPRDKADMADFSRARLVLTTNTYLPRQLWFEQPNGNEVTWDFDKLYKDVQLPPVEFQRPVAPPGWQLVPAERPAGPGGAPAPSGGGPRVIRPQN
jgi:TIGR03009 family protein